MKILFILDHKLMNYRLPFFEQLAARGYDLTVIHPGPILETKLFSQKRSTSKKVGLGFEYRKYDKVLNPEVLIYMQNIRILNLWMVSLNPFRRFKLIHWGIGVSSSEGLSLQKTFISRLRSFLSLFSSAMILYSKYPLPLFPKSVRKKTFIANNTIFNPHKVDFSFKEKSTFLFIGSLNNRKGIEDLIISFSELTKKIAQSDLQLDIIGEGEEKSKLIELSNNLGVAKKVNFLGKISSPPEKELYFSKAIACISPKQAGLSVLESFSYGVPFIAYKNAISGGEHLNIKSGYNGYLLSSREELVDTMESMYTNKKLSKMLGKNAFKFYTDKRQMKNMVDTFETAFNYVKNN